MRRGFIDHSDSLGANARFGRGDVQWLTAGSGIVHSEMFPLLDRDVGNPLELFQIWLNLAADDKFAEPHFAMLWDADIPRVVTSTTVDGRAAVAEVTVIAGEWDDVAALGSAPAFVGGTYRQRRRDLARPSRAWRAMHAARCSRR